MIARVRKIKANTANLDGLKEEWPRYPRTMTKKGLKSGFVAVDPKTGEGYSVSIWESEKAMKASENDPNFKDAYKVLGSEYFTEESVRYFEVLCALP